MNFELKKQCLIPGSIFYELCDLKQDIWPFPPILLMRLEGPTKSVAVRSKCDNVSKVHCRVRPVENTLIAGTMSIILKNVSCLAFQFYKSSTSLLYGQTR